MRSTSLATVNLKDGNFTGDPVATTRTFGGPETTIIDALWAIKWRQPGLWRSRGGDKRCLG
jgi:hypothetical protein